MKFKQYSTFKGITKNDNDEPCLYVLYYDVPWIHDDVLCLPSSRTCGHRSNVPCGRVLCSVFLLYHGNPANKI